MNLQWSEPLEQMVQETLYAQESGEVFPKEEVFLELPLEVDALRNRDIFYHDGADYRLTLQAEDVRRQWKDDHREYY